jgi:hypothetical protein
VEEKFDRSNAAKQEAKKQRTDRCGIEEKVGSVDVLPKNPC